MSTNFITFHPSTLSASCNACRKPSSSSNSGFALIFGWPNTPDYIESTADPEVRKSTTMPKFVPRGFTDEKAKLRMMKTGKKVFHDVMYHSTIASRLASDFSTRSDS